MVPHLTCTDPMEITAGATVITEASVGVVVMAGTDMAEDTVGEAMDGVVDMVTTDNDISKTGSYEIS